MSSKKNILDKIGKEMLELEREGDSDDACSKFF